MRDFDEADKIVTLLTREEGKVQAVARGARRPRNRFAATTQLFTHCQVALFSGRRMETLSQSEIVDSFRLLREDLSRMAYAAYLCEVVDETVQEKQRSEGVFLLLLACLHLLAAEEVDPEPVTRAFELKLMAQLGYRPVLTECAGCGASLPPGEVRFSPALGGALCQREHEGEGPLLRISRGALEAIRHLLEGDLRRAHLLRMGPEIGAQVARAVEEFVSWRLDRRLRSLEFLRSVRDSR